MRLQKINSKDILFTYTHYEQSLLLSIKRIGLSFPIKVSRIDGKYYCQDGHKRLSAILDILADGDNTLVQQIYIIVTNDGSSRSNDCWRGRNTH